MSLRILLVDDDALVRAGLKAVLGTEPDIDVVGEAGTGAEAISAVHALTPDLVLMDIRMPEMDGLAATASIVDGGGPRVLILTTFELDEYVYEAMRVGASGFMLKRSSPEDLVRAVRKPVLIRRRRVFRIIRPEGRARGQEKKCCGEQSANDPAVGHVP